MLAGGICHIRTVLVRCRAHGLGAGPLSFCGALTTNALPRRTRPVAPKSSNSARGLLRGQAELGRLGPCQWPEPDRPTAFAIADFPEIAPTPPGPSQQLPLAVCVRAVLCLASTAGPRRAALNPSPTSPLCGFLGSSHWLETAVKRSCGWPGFKCQMPLAISVALGRFELGAV